MSKNNPEAGMKLVKNGTHFFTVLPGIYPNWGIMYLRDMAVPEGHPDSMFEVKISEFQDWVEHGTYDIEYPSIINRNSNG